MSFWINLCLMSTEKRLSPRSFSKLDSLATEIFLRLPAKPTLNFFSNTIGTLKLDCCAKEGGAAVSAVLRLGQLLAPFPS